MWTTIAYKLAQENNDIVRIYIDDTEKAFDSQVDATDYCAYLLEKGYANVDMYEKITISAGGINISELKKQDALNKLTTEEKALLGLS